MMNRPRDRRCKLIDIKHHSLIDYNLINKNLQETKSPFFDEKYEILSRNHRVITSLDDGLSVHWAKTSKYSLIYATGIVLKNKCDDNLKTQSFKSKTNSSKNISKWKESTL